MLLDIGRFFHPHVLQNVHVQCSHMSTMGHWQHFHRHRSEGKGLGLGLVYVIKVVRSRCHVG